MSYKSKFKVVIPYLGGQQGLGHGRRHVFVGPQSWGAVVHVQGFVVRLENLFNGSRAGLAVANEDELVLMRNNHGIIAWG